MKHTFKTTINDIEFKIGFSYYPPEPRTESDPGCPEEIEIEGVRIELDNFMTLWDVSELVEEGLIPKEYNLEKELTDYVHRCKKVNEQDRFDSSCLEMEDWI